MSRTSMLSVGSRPRSVVSFSRPGRRTGVLVLGCILWGLGTAESLTPARAADINWSAASGGTWLEAGHWSPATVPGAGDTAIFDLAAAYTVDAQPAGTAGVLSTCAGNINSAPVTAERVSVRRGEVTMLLCAGATMTAGSSASLGVSGGARLDLAGGSYTAVNAVIGDSGATAARMVLRGAGTGGGSDTTLTSSGQIVVGQLAAGELSVVDGGVINANLFAIGDHASGCKVTVSGRPAAARPSRISTSGAFFVGRLGPGELLVENGGRVEVAAGLQLVVGLAAGDSTVEVAGGANLGGTFHPSELSVGGFLQLSAPGTSRLIVRDGARVVAKNAGIPANAGAAEVTVRGGTDQASLLEVAESVLLGANTSGTSSAILSVLEGGKCVADSLTLGKEDGGPSTVTVSGRSSTGRASSLQVAQTLTVGEKAASTLRVTDGGTVSAGQITITDRGTLAGDGQVTAGTVTNNGTVSPGASPGTLTVAGNYTQGSAGRLVIEIGGNTAGTFDVLSVGGSLTLDGTVELRFINGYLLQPGDVITFAIAGSAVAGSPAVTAFNVAANGTATPTNLPPGSAVEISGLSFVLRGPADNCPGDPAKAEPGICGCGVPDTDTDGDGTPDCNDACDNDPAKIVAGQCGCGTPDTDTDGDGIADCLDAPPDGTPVTAACGACGAGTAGLSPLMLLVLVPRFVRRGRR